MGREALARMHFAVFGCGSSAYDEHIFNKVCTFLGSSKACILPIQRLLAGNEGCTVWICKEQAQKDALEE